MHIQNAVRLSLNKRTKCILTVNILLCHIFKGLSLVLVFK